MRLNMDKLGKDPEHNVLYITGLPGSGKTTLAEEIADGRGEIIHLDAYADLGDVEMQNQEFNSFISKKDPYLKIVAEAGIQVDSFPDMIQLYGLCCYGKKIVIVEGFQIFTGWLHYNDRFYIGKPLIILDPPIQTAITQMAKRDGLTGDQVSDLLDHYQRLNQDFLAFKEKFE